MEVTTSTAVMPVASKVVNEEEVIASARQSTEEDEYEENKRLCLLNNFKPPIHYKIFNKLKFRYTRNFLDSQLISTDDIILKGTKPYDDRFLSGEELAAIPRKIKKPFCHPGPELKDELYHWYLVDSIVQEVKLKGDQFTSFVVRWVGYEDQYNTLEPFANMKDTAVHTLFVKSEVKTACRSNNSCVRKSRTDISGGEKIIEEVGLSMSNHACLQLISELKNEEIAGRYSDLIGFYSNESTAMALKHQHEFISKKFLPLINGLRSSVYVDKHYIGTTYGNLQGAAEFKNVVDFETKNSLSIKNYFYDCLRKAKSAQVVGPHFVCFLVPRKFDTDEKTTKNHLSLHMCAYIVKSYGQLKDAIYFDPSPECYHHDPPIFLQNLKQPAVESFTFKFGVASDKDDCLFQVMLYLMKLATGEVSFETNELKQCRKVDRHTENRKKKPKFT